MIGKVKFDAPLTMNQGNVRESVVFAAMVAGFALLAACGGGASERTSQINAEEGRRLFATAPATDSADSGAPNSGSSAMTVATGWGIMLEHFTGAGHAQSAERRSIELASMLSRGDVRVMRRQSGSAVVLGVYPGPGDQRAIRDLRFVHGFQYQGQRPFARSFLAPPQTITDPGQVPELSLSSAKRQFGSRAEYTLQIGVYESANQAEAKSAAEQAAMRLRSEGELAFYHHGQFRSMVTIGVFDASDYNDRQGIRNPQLISLKNRYPLNLLNGQYPIIVKRPGGPESKQRSMLVQIPD